MIIIINIIKNYITNNIHYKASKIINVKGLVIHSVGCPQPDPNVFVKNWNNSSNKYLTQLVIGAEKVYEVLPCTRDKHKAVFCYHVGNANSYTIGAEMTEPSTIKYTSGANWIDLNPEKTKAHVLATYANAVDVFAQLCIFHGLDPLKDGIILSHSECHKRGIGTNHGDVEHIWDKFGLTMDQFRKDIKMVMDGISNSNSDIQESIKPIEQTKTINKGDIVKIASDAVYYSGRSIPSWVKKQNWIVKVDPVDDRVVIDKNVDGTNSINSPINIKYLTVVESSEGQKTESSISETFLVRIAIDDLNIRTGPGVFYDAIKYIPRGVYTIVEVNGDWGRLKSKQAYEGKSVNGWIHLGYATKL